MAERQTHLFVYGTLMPDRLRWPILAAFARAHRPAEVAGRLYDSGNGWPVAVFGGAGAIHDVIPGVLVELEPMLVDEALAILDEIEDTATDTLRRIEVTTVDGVPAWAYHHAHSTERFVRIERWADQAER